jgi:diacylglycerol O-acyltransferase / wax synthase
MQRLTGLDATFLYLETPTTHMHVASTAVFDPRTVPEGYSFEAMRSLVLDRLPLLPPFRRRLVEVPFALHHPIWIEDPDFDIDYHLRRAALPSPGGARELSAFAADVTSRPLDRRRPLWEMYVVEGLEDGLIACITKVHHSAIDGVSGAELTVNLLDLTPEPAEVPPQEEEWKADRVPSDLEMVGSALSSLARQPVAAIKAARRTVEMGLNLRRRNRQPGVTPPPAPFSAPKTLLNRAITSHRVLAYSEVHLDQVKAIKDALGGTVNDVVMAICSGALRRYLAEHDDLPTDKSLVAMVPVSVRSEDEKGTMGNKVSSMFVLLATHIDGPLERYAAIVGGTSAAKDQERAISASVLTDWTEFAAPALAARAFRLASSMKVLERMTPIFNVTISNVPGPPFPLYSAGAQMKAMYPMGPIADGVGLNITVMSYMGTMFFGLLACPEVVPDIWDLAAHMNEALNELTKAAEAVGKPARRAPAHKAAAPS